MLFYADRKILVKKAHREPGKTEFQERIPKSTKHILPSEFASFNAF